MADYLPPVVAKLTGDDSNLSSVLTRAKEKVRRFAADVSRVQATINIDAKLKDGSLAEVRRRVTDGPAAKLKVELQLAVGQREEINRGLQQRPVQVAVKPVMDQVALRQVKAVLRELGKRIDVSVRPQIHEPSALRTLNRLNRLSTDRTVTIRTRVTGDTNSLSGSGGAGGAGGGIRGILGTLLPLAPAIMPIAASAVTLAASITAATVAVGAFGAAVIPQIKSLSDASTAQTAYNAAVSKYGAQSKQAVTAQAEFSATLAAMPPQTRQAAGAFLVFKDSFKSWSDGLSQFTMAPVTRSLAVVQAILPKLTPMVKGVSTQLSRLVAVAGGAVSSPGFDSLTKRFSDFANKALKAATDGIIHFSRVLAGGAANGPVAQFLTYAKTNGPLVKDALANISKAVMNLLNAASQAGPGMLSLVNAAARLVAALPPAFVGQVLQLYSALKLIGLARAGFSAVSGAVTALSGRIVALRAASIAAGGGVAGLRAAFATLSTAAKASVVVAAIAGIALGLTKLSNIGKKAPPDVDKMATAIGNLGRTGKVSGEALRVYGADLGTLADSMHNLAKPSNLDQVQQFLTSLIGMDSTPVKEWKQNVDAADKSLASLVKGGNADLAAAAFERIKAAAAKQGVSVKALQSQYGDYQSALADAAFEQKLAADSMGLFGNQAAAVKTKLDAQKASADGLRQAIQALNDVNRAGLDGMIGFEASVAAAAKAAKDNAGALHMVHGQLDLTTDKARSGASALTDLAAKTDSAASAARDNGSSWSTVNSIYTRGREKLIAAADAMGLTRAQARQLADQILKTPDKTARLKGNMEDLQAKLASAKSQLARVPDSRKASVRATIADLEAKIRQARADLNALNGKTAQTYIKTIYQYYTKKPAATGPLASGFVPNATGGLYAGGVKHFAGGGENHVAQIARGGDWRVWAEPETQGEAYIPFATSKRARSRQIAEETVKRLGGKGVAWADGGLGSAAGSAMTGAGRQAGSGLASGLIASVGQVDAAARVMGAAVTSGIRSELQIASPSKKTAALAADVGMGFIVGMTGSKAKILSTAKDLAKDIWTAWAGTKSKKDSQLVAMVYRDNAALQKLATQRDSVAVKLKSAQTKLSDLQKAWTAERDQIAAGVMSGTSIVTSAPQDGFALTGQDVLNSMRTQMAQTQQFAANLQALKVKGLRSDLIEQLAVAGFDQGGATAQALAGASKSTIAQINSTQASMNTAANATGKTVADSMYSAGIQSAQGLIKGLQSQQKAIDKQMLKIAKSMQSAIKKALGIRSPSAVMAELGDFTAQGMAVGINRSTKHATIAAQGLAMSVRQGAALTGSPIVGGAGAPVTAGLALGGGANTSVVHHHHYESHVTVEGHVLTERKLRDVVEESMLRLGGRNPRTYAPYKR